MPVIAMLVVDRSGSMEGEKMAQARRALRTAVDFMGETSRVGLVSYSEGVSIDAPIAGVAFQERGRLLGAIHALQAHGNTAMYDAVAVAADALIAAREQEGPPEARLRMLVLSDGATNTGHGYAELAPVLDALGIPAYTVGYGAGAGVEELRRLSGIAEAAAITADEGDVAYRIASLANAQM